MKPAEGRRVEERFWAKVDKNGPVPTHRPELGRCWVWTAYIDHKGYGQFWIHGHDRRAPRIAHELFKGPIPPNLTIDHLCRTRACVRPEHLEAVTMKENVLRGDAPTAINARKTRCKKGHALTTGTNGKRRCRICFLAYMKRWHNEHKGSN